MQADLKSKGTQCKALYRLNIKKPREFVIEREILELYYVYIYLYYVYQRYLLINNKITFRVHFVVFEFRGLVYNFHSRICIWRRHVT